MKLVKTRLRNRMEDEFLAHSLIAANPDSNYIIDDFKSLKEQ